MPKSRITKVRDRFESTTTVEKVKEQEKTLAEISKQVIEATQELQTFQAV